MIEFHKELNNSKGFEILNVTVEIKENQTSFLNIVNADNFLTDVP